LAFARVAEEVEDVAGRSSVKRESRTPLFLEKREPVAWRKGRVRRRRRRRSAGSVRGWFIRRDPLHHQTSLEAPRMN
jgi:hypothetical protein